MTMSPRQSRAGVFAIVLLALAVTLGLVTGSAGAKNAKKKGGTATVTVSGNQAIPAAASPVTQGLLNSTAVVNKKFKGREIDDVNVTLLATASGAGSSINSLNARLTAPNGNTVFLFSD